MIDMQLFTKIEGITLAYYRQDNNKYGNPIYRVFPVDNWWIPIKEPYIYRNNKQGYWLVSGIGNIGDILPQLATMYKVIRNGGLD